MIAALLDASLRAFVIAVVVGLALKAWRIHSGAVRHAAWSAVLLTMLALPVAPSWMPTIRLPFPSGTTPQVAGVSLPLSSATAVPAIVTTPTVSAWATGSSAFVKSAVRPAARPPTTQSWAAFATGMWLLGAIVLAVRVLVGWRRAARLLADARRIDTGRLPVTSPSDLYESSRIATPVAVGVWRPRVVLPTTWQTWPLDTLGAVLVHERAHVTRRDAVVALVARVNACVFWFHPLAWWIQSQLAEAAEQACDDRVLRVTQTPTSYAAVLVSMAGAVQRQGSRVAWQGLGISGGRLAVRIDRVLRGEGLREPSVARRFAVGLTCGAIIAFGVACRQQPAPLKADPTVTDRLTRNNDDATPWKVAQNLTMDQVAALETRAESNPDDLETARTVLTFYQTRGQQTLGWNAMLAARRPQMLRVIDRHPESDLAAWPLFLRQYDPIGYAEARTLWLAHVGAGNVTPKVLGNAAMFFSAAEKPLAEALLLRALAMDPDGPQPRTVGNLYYEPWIARLGTLYARAIVGSDDDTIGNVVKSVNLDEAHGPFAAAVRKKLEHSTDAALLAATGRYLVVNAHEAVVRLDFDSEALGMSYVRRALQLDPQNTVARQIVVFQSDVERAQGMSKALPGSTWAEKEAELAALSDRERLQYSPHLAELAYMRAENAEAAGRTAEFQELTDRASRFAREALSLAEASRGDPEVGAEMFSAHLTLGIVALRRGDRAEAVREMRRAADAPASAGLAELQSPWHDRLTNYLLKAGERESVIAFFEKAATILPLQRDQLLQDAAAVRSGLMPRAYQYAFAPRTTGQSGG